MPSSFDMMVSDVTLRRTYGPSTENVIVVLYTANCLKEAIRDHIDSLIHSLKDNSVKQFQIEERGITLIMTVFSQILSASATRSHESRYYLPS
jgi:hypothetical protein